VICITSQGQPTANTLIDATGQARERYGAVNGSAYLVRPDGYLMGCWPMANAQAIAAALLPFQQEPA
jgi:3-(3-hydroxy-phenyl)propionate hydroxylase